MKTAISTIVYIITLLFPGVMLPQENGLDSEIAELKQAYLSYKRDSMLLAHSNFEKQYKKNNAPLTLSYITFTEYKLLEMSLSEENEDLFDKYYDSAQVHAEKLAEQKGYEKYGKGLLAAIYMMKVATSSMSAVTLSPKIHSLLDEVQEIDPGNAFSYFIRGSMKYNTPGIFGGSYEDALKNFNKAAKLYEKDPEQLPVWGHSESLVWAGRSQNELGNIDAAKFTYKKVLDIEPDYGWVKYILLPEIEGAK